MSRKIYIILSLFFVVYLIVHAQNHDGKIKPDEQLDWKGWKIDSIAPGYIWYNYTGYYPDFDSNQTVNVISIDYKQSEYELQIVHNEIADSLSSFANKHGAIAGINGSYFEADVSFIRVDGKTYREITVTKDHVRYWKHEGALFYDNEKKKIEIAYGNNKSYKSSTYRNILSGAPILIDNYKPVGETFATVTDSVDIKKLDYEDYRRHQGVRHPRVAIALTGNDKLLFITVDGRWQPSAGMSAKELTQFIRKYFNPRYALNLDGGGSTTMWIKGRGTVGSDVVNFPTDNKRYDHYGQRAVNNVILLKKK